MTLRLSADLELPVDLVTQATAILARRGAGKTYTARKIAEQVIRAGQPIVILDPLGGFWGLRSSADGRRAGLPVVIIGGEHGDVPLEPTAGRVIADVVVEHPGAYVIDLSGFESKAAEQRFAGDFLERLYRAKATRREALLLVVDEADMLAPQRPGPEQTRTLGALEAIVRRGRIRGLGVVLISQRAAVLNKNCLTQTEVLIVMQTTGPQDRAAIDEWIRGNGTPEEREQVLGSLASLGRGEAWLWSPSWLRRLVRITVARTETFDSSATPEAGQAAIEPRAFATVDLEALGERITATIERAKADDPKELRRRVRELEGTVETMRTANRQWESIAERAREEVRVERVEVPVLNGQVEDLRALVEQLADVGQKLVHVGATITTAIERVQAAPAPRVDQLAASAPRVVQPVATRPPTSAAGRPRAELTAMDDEVPLGRAERTFLAALAQYPRGLSRTRLSLITGYRAKSGHFNNVLGRLRSLGLVERGDPIVATPAGIAAAGVVGPLPAPGPELVDYWLGRLGKAEAAFLAAFAGAWPDALTREDLAVTTGYAAASGHFNNTLGRLRGLGLVDGYRASDDLMRGD